MDPMIARVIEREGGYTDDPHDAGGCTKYGITLATLRAARNNPALSCADVQSLTEEQAAAIYAMQYMRPFAGIGSVAVRELLFDSAVQHGVGTAARWLQAAVGVAQDGDVGPQTRAAANQAPSSRTFAAIYGMRLGYYASIVVNRPDQSGFLKGWMNRMADVLEQCLADAGATLP